MNSIYCLADVNDKDELIYLAKDVIYLEKVAIREIVVQ